MIIFAEVSVHELDIVVIFCKRINEYNLKRRIYNNEILYKK